MELQGQGSATPGSSSRFHQDGSASGACSGLGNGPRKTLSCAQSSLCHNTALNTPEGLSSPDPASQHGHIRGIPALSLLSQQDQGYPEAASTKRGPGWGSGVAFCLLCPMVQKPPKLLHILWDWHWDVPGAPQRSQNQFMEFSVCPGILQWTKQGDTV